MLYISNTSIFFSREEDLPKEFTPKRLYASDWHIGSPVPPTSPVMFFQADGDELTVILEALKATHK